MNGIRSRDTAGSLSPRITAFVPGAVYCTADPQQGVSFVFEAGQHFTAIILNHMGMQDGEKRDIQLEICQLESQADTLIVWRSHMTT